MSNVAELITEHVKLTVDCGDPLSRDVWLPSFRNGLSRPFSGPAGNCRYWYG